MIGKEILNYVIISKIGSGGMGTVYIAEHKHIREQKVAIKMIHSEMVNDFTRKRLTEEAKHLAKLDHPNIVKFINYHIDDDGNIYLIMEYAEGVTIEKYLNEVNGLIVEDRICGIFEPILDAFGYAHSKGIIHRDIKPSNIIVTPDGTPKILDFGIATIIGCDEEEGKMIVGTPSYMSPEQVKSEHLDQRSDVYSLGVLLHQMLTGTAPYDTSTLTEHEISEKVVNESLPPLRSYYKYVSNRTQKVVDKATAKEADKRFQSCSDFKKALHKAIFPTRMPKWVWAAAILVVIAAAVGGWWYWDYHRTKVFYYKDYTEQWGVPVGIGEIAEDDISKVMDCYRMEMSEGKVRRLTHINSHGKAVPVNTTEIANRPVDAYYDYGSNDKLKKVTVKDKSGTVVHVMDYNDNLSTVTFRYDDEHGTEMTLSASSLATNDFMSGLQDEHKKSKISRYHFTYNDDGYVTKIRYAGPYNIPASDDNGIYGKQFTIDGKGRVIEESFLDINDEPTQTSWGLAKKLFEYDGDNNRISTSYFTADDQPSLSSPDGLQCEKLSYDKNGNLIKALFFADTDTPMMVPAFNNVFGKRFTYNDKGEMVREENLDDLGNPMLDSDNVAASVYTYDNNGFLTEIKCLGIDDEPIINKYNSHRGVAVNDANGNILQQFFFDVEGNAAMLDNNFASTKSTYDSKGNRTSVFFYDTEGNLTPINALQGASGYRQEYDSYGRVTKQIYYNTDSIVAPNDEGTSVRLFTFDPVGNLIEDACFEDVECTIPQSNAFGCAKAVCDFDDKGNLKKCEFFDVNGNLTESSQTGIATQTYEYDGAGRMTETRWYDAKRNPKLDNFGTIGVRYSYNAVGDTIEIRPLVNEAKLPDHLYIVKRKYDDNRNLISLSYWGDNNEPRQSSGVHEIVNKYNSRKQNTEKRTYNTHGLLCSPKGTTIAIERYEYDNRGNLSHASFYGVDGKPTLGNDKYWSVAREFDAMGHVIHERYFGKDGKPTDPQIMVPEGIAEYDKNGNIIQTVSLDGNGNKIYNPQMGATTRRAAYDKRNNQIEESYFDIKDKPTISKTFGFHKVMMEYDNRGNRIASMMYDTDGKPMNNTISNIHKIANEYDELNRQKNERYYDKNGTPTVNANGVHKVVFKYSGNNPQAMSVDFYDASGSILGSNVWNGTEYVWQSHYVSSSSSWQETVRNLNAELPTEIEEGVHILSFHQKGEYGVELIMQVDMTAGDISEEMLKEFRNIVVSQFADYIRAYSGIPDYVSIYLILKDGNGTVITKETI